MCFLLQSKYLLLIRTEAVPCVDAKYVLVQLVSSSGEDIDHDKLGVLLSGN